MPRSCWPYVTASLFVVVLSLGLGRAVLPALVLRFSDTLVTQDASPQTASARLPMSELEAPVVSANSWLMRHGWKQVWPLSGL